MPIEIRELHITTVVDDNKETKETPETLAQRDADPQQIIAACVEQVLEILEQKNER